MKKRNVIIIAIFAVAIAAALIAQNIGDQSSGPAGGPPAGAPGMSAGTATGASAFSVRTATVERATIQDYIETNGDVVVDATVKVYPYVAGKLVSVRVALGSRVEKGQLIAEIDPSTPGSAYALNPVYAPIAGTVTSLPVSAGSTVTSSSAIAEVGIIDELEIEARIAERYVGVLRTGLKAVVTLEAYPGERFAATVTAVSPIVDSTSRTKTVRLAFDSPDGRVNAGMFAKIRLDTVTYAGRLVIEDSGVLSDSTGSYVFVVGADDTVSRRSVTTGADVDGVVELASGVKEGELVVIEGASALTDGSAIKDISSSAAARAGTATEGARQ